MLHRFKKDVSKIEKPEVFSNPFGYEPHILVIEAEQEAREMFIGYADELKKGKMMGVMVVEDKSGEIGYIVAFSGLLAGKNSIDGYVPSVYDFLDEEGFFKQGEREVGLLTEEIIRIERKEDYAKQKEHLVEAEKEYKTWMYAEKEDMKRHKAERKEKKDRGEMDAATHDRLVREQQEKKIRHEREKADKLAAFAILREQIREVDSELKELKDKRTAVSSRVQKEMFDHFIVSNAKGERRTIADIFAQYNGQNPPAGAGECAGPKLLQYAYQHGLKPLSMGEFWVGETPKSEVRKDGQYYMACERMCRPILTYMMQGMEVDEERLLRHQQPTVVWEDEWIVVVNKPSGMLSVPGKVEQDSVYDWAKRKYEGIEEPVIVHRLDMSTSGLLVLAKTKEAHKAMQALFETRAIRKTYEAVVERQLIIDNGEFIIGEDGWGKIDLPLCVDIDNRPKQMVSYEYGKRAVTKYRIISHEDRESRLELMPVTGRTHQLRVHCAVGLGVAIKGDELYGDRSCMENGCGRLCLHARDLSFVHPFTNQEMFLSVAAEF